MYVDFFCANHCIFALENTSQHNGNQYASCMSYAYLYGQSEVANMIEVVGNDRINYTRRT